MAWLISPVVGFVQSAEIQRSDGTVLRSGSPLRSEAGRFVKVFVNRDDAVVSATHLDSPKINTTLNFMQAAWVAEKYPPQSAAPTAFLLTKSADGRTVSEPIGWVQADDVLTEEHPIYAAPGIYGKCLIVNRVEQVKDKSKYVRLTTRPATARPDEEDAQEIRMNNVYFVYKKSKDKKYVLLGNSPAFYPDKPREVIRGWAPVDRIAYWNTRFGFEWDMRSLRGESARETPGVVFNSQQVAEQYADKAMAYAPASQLRSLIDQHASFRENIDKRDSRRVPFYASDQPRFIVMSRDDSASDTDSLKAISTRGKYELFRVGATGSTQAEQIQYRQGLADLKQSLRKVEMMFLICNTKEMEDHFSSSDSIKSPIEQMVRELLEDYRLRLSAFGDERRELNLSISFYADEKYSSKPFTINPLVPVGNGAMLEEQLVLFKKIRGDGGGDAPKSVIAGIENATAKFSPIGNKRRILIVIGTMGDRLGDEPDKLQERINAIASKATSAGMPLEIYCIQVATKTTTTDHPDAQRFVQQMNQLCDAMNASWQVRTKTLDTIASVSKASDDGKDTNALITRINERVADVDKLSSEALKALSEAFETGRAVPAETNTILGNFLSSRLRQNGVDPDKVQADVFNEGFLWRHSFDLLGDILQVRTMVLVEREQVENLHRILQEITRRGTYMRGQPQDIDTLSKTVLSNLVGDSHGYSKPNESMADYFARRSLPFQSNFMKAVAEGSRSATLDDQGLLKLQEVQLKLNDILKESYCEYVKEVRKLESGETIFQLVEVPGSRRPFNRMVVNEGGAAQTVYVWLDLQEEMP